MTSSATHDGEHQGEHQGERKGEHKTVKLYWLIPDGLRAEPETFQLFQWAENGELPNIKKLMSRGSYGYSIPVFPSHTPVNYASLLSGALPKTHGVADGPMHTFGSPLNSVAVTGFSSMARKVPALWSLLEDHDIATAILSVPGSTPPEIQNGWVVRGRWGGWGVDLPGLNFELATAKNAPPASTKSLSPPPLTQFINFDKSQKDRKWLTANADRHFFTMKAWDQQFYGAHLGKQVAFSIDGQKEAVRLKQGEWSSWLPVRIANLHSQVKFHVIKLSADGFFRVRLLFNNLNETVTLPASLAEDLTKSIGPMVDFVDNYPPQLVSYEEDKSTFLNEMTQSFDWHTQLIHYVLKTLQPGAVIHGIYDPNQMLTSRWWMGQIDPMGLSFKTTSADEKAQTLKEVKDMYKRVDQMVGQILENSDPSTYIVFSSDHGVCALRQLVRLNNLFAKRGWLKFKMIPGGDHPVVDWQRTQVVFLKMDGIYINPGGLDGPWRRSSGAKYENLRKEVMQSVTELADETGAHPLSQVVAWEDAEKKLSLPPDRVGDLIIANHVGFGWDEEITTDLAVFAQPPVTGYKQAISTEMKCMWTPFIIAGPNIKKGFALGQPVHHVDQLPTIIKALKIQNTKIMDGRSIDEIFQ